VINFENTDTGFSREAVEVRWKTMNNGRFILCEAAKGY
jgi:hypothetical protein